LPSIQGVSSSLLGVENKQLVEDAVDSVAGRFFVHCRPHSRRKRRTGSIRAQARGGRGDSYRRFPSGVRTGRRHRHAAADEAAAEKRLYTVPARNVRRHGSVPGPDSSATLT
jgi:hypothetical protein